MTYFFSRIRWRRQGLATIIVLKLKLCPLQMAIQKMF